MYKATSHRIRIPWSFTIRVESQMHARVTDTCCQWCSKSKVLLKYACIKRAFPQFKHIPFLKCILSTIKGVNFRVSQFLQIKCSYFLLCYLGSYTLSEVQCLTITVVVKCYSVYLLLYNLN